MSVSDMTAEESTKLAEMVADLHARGYQTVEWDDGCDREWLHHFVNMLDAGNRTTEALIDEVTSW